MDTTRKTIGIDPKIVAQVIVSAVVWAVLRYTGIDISAQAETLVALLAGLIAGWLAPAPKTVVEGDVPPVGPRPGELGAVTLVEIGALCGIVALVIIAIVVF